MFGLSDGMGLFLTILAIIYGAMCFLVPVYVYLTAKRLLVIMNLLEKWAKREDQFKFIK